MCWWGEGSEGEVGVFVCALWWWWKGEVCVCEYVCWGVEGRCGGGEKGGVRRKKKSTRQHSAG